VLGRFSVERKLRALFAFRHAVTLRAFQRAPP
jgi:hypothetical protein